MNKADFIAMVVEETDSTKGEAERYVKAIFGCIKESLKQNQELRLKGFGTFKVSNHAEKTVRNPQNGQPIKVPASKRAKFVPSKDLKDAVNS